MPELLWGVQTTHNIWHMVWPVFVMLATVNHFCWETQHIYVNTQCRILSSCLLNKHVKINNLKASIKLYCRTSQGTKCASTRWVLLEPCRTLHCAGSTEFLVLYLVVRVVITRLWRVNVYRSVIILVLWHPDRRTLTGVVVNRRKWQEKGEICILRSFTFLCCSLNVIWAIRSSLIGLAGHVARRVYDKCVQNVFKNPEMKLQFGSRKQEWVETYCKRMWNEGVELDPSTSACGTVTSFYEHGNEPWGFIKVCDFLLGVRLSAY